ncbi:TPA: hypothetical protein DEP21_03860 [Patescibacteria group bacterium]|nr:hypothetical protein [Candidatus Gracilibacteria bacterium]
MKDKKLDPLDRKKYVLAKAYELAINDKNLSEEKRKQIKNLSLDFYEQTKDFVEFDQIRSKEMLEEVKTLSYQKYQEQTQETPKNTTFDKMKDKLLTPEAMNVLFDKNPNYQKYQIGEETFKDVPEESMLKFNKAIIPEGLKKFFDEKGDLNPEEVKKAKPEEKKNLDEFQKNRINDTKSELAKDTNETVKVQAINICMDTLKSMFDITVENK